MRVGFTLLILVMLVGEREQTLDREITQFLKIEKQKGDIKMVPFVDSPSSVQPTNVHPMTLVLLPTLYICNPMKHKSCVW